MPVSFHDWIFSNYPPDAAINGRWGVLHILTLALCMALIILFSVWGNRRMRVRKPILYTLIAILLLFELTRRGINLSRGYNSNVPYMLRTLLPRPWCAISCWLLILAPVIRKPFFYNLCSTNALLCALVFFAYPSVGFNHKYILFENVYSIVTHALLLICSILLITLRFTDFRYVRRRRDSALHELLGLALIFAYAFFEVFCLKIEPDPMYFLPNNEVQGVLGVSYPLYMIIYVAFLMVYFNAFYMVQKLLSKRHI